MTESSILRVRDYGKRFELHEQNKLIPSAQSVDLDVFSGCLTALVGPTGAGKSTVLKGIYRTYLPSTGSLLYTDRSGTQIDLATADDYQVLALRRSEIGFVTQFLRSLPRQATEDVVAQPLTQQGVDRHEALDKARELLAAMNLPERLWRISPATFSGGEKQRVNLARGLVAKPRLLLLDEPTASLDPATAERVIELLAGLKHEGIGMLAVFHHSYLVERLADHVVELQIPSWNECPLEEIA